MAQCSVENMLHFVKHRPYKPQHKLSKKKNFNVKGSANVKFAKVDTLLTYRWRALSHLQLQTLKFGIYCILETGYNPRGQGSTISDCYVCFGFFLPLQGHCKSHGRK